LDLSFDACSSFDLNSLSPSDILIGQDNKILNSPSSASLVSPNGVGTDTENGVIYRANASDPSRMLSCDSKLSISYAVSASLTNDSDAESVSTSLGSLLIDWRPLAVDLPVVADGAICTDNFGMYKSHGPLALETPSTVCFAGPQCFVERAPFEAIPLKMKWPLMVTRPFTVRYLVRNTTNLHRALRIELREGEANRTNPSGLMFSGCTNGMVTLGPLDEHIVSYTIVATRPGEISLPSLRVSSDRYRSWIINEGADGKRVFIYP
jgi:hypothetical protein